MNNKYTSVKSDNLDLKIENKMYMKENSRLNKIIIAQKQVTFKLYIFIFIIVFIMYYNITIQIQYNINLLILHNKN